MVMITTNLRKLSFFLYLSLLLILRIFFLVAFSRSTSRGRAAHSVETFRMKTVAMLRTMTIMLIR